MTFGNKKFTLLLAKRTKKMKEAIIQYLSEGFGAPYLLQLWSYAPQRLGGDGGMDVLSLVLSLADERNDRVQIEIDRILEGFKW